MYKAAVILSTVGIILLGVAIALPFVFPRIFNSKINDKLIIRPDAEIMKNFKETPIPLTYQVYFFNITNVDEIVQGGKAILNQVGPFTYYQYRKRNDINFNDDLGTVLFQPQKTFHFKPELSVGPDTIQITTLDPVYMSLASKLSAEGIPGVAKSVVQLLFMRFGNKPFLTHSVRELLYDGYDEPLLGELFKVTKDPKHKLAKFGYFVATNATSSGEVEIYSGQQGMSNYQHIVKWHGKSSLNFWKTELCNKINGTDGAQFVRPVKRSQPLYLFSPELCRSIYAVFEKDVMLGPVTLHRFILPDALFNHATDEYCFCTNDFTCRSSMIDLSTCKNGSPIVASPPHFYQGDKIDQEAVEGLNPNKAEHETYLDVEPTTGVSLRIAKRLQINIPLKRYADFPTLLSVREVVMPIFWVNESIEVPMDRVEKLHVTLTLPLTVVTYGSWVLLGAGIFLVLIACIITVRTYKKNKALQKRRQDITDNKNSSNNSALLEKKLYEVS